MSQSFTPQLKKLLTRQLMRRLGQELPEATKQCLSTLTLPILENLSEVLLDFTALADLEQWLVEQEESDL
jgi:dTDP-4-amino-4,6-dideoxygalactose transaminase